MAGRSCGCNRPDSNKPLICVLKHNVGISEKADHVQYKMTDGEGRPVPEHVTHIWEGSLLPLAPEPYERGGRSVNLFEVTTTE